MWAACLTVLIHVSLCSATFIPAQPKPHSMMRSEQQSSSIHAEGKTQGVLDEVTPRSSLHADVKARGAGKISEAQKDLRQLITVRGNARSEKQRRRDAESAVLELAHGLLQTFQAGSGYQERVWIRDSATFLGEALNAGVAHNDAKNVLTSFFKHQGKDGNIADWYIPSTGQTDKNTVATDQETSLVQAVHTYVKHTGEVEFLHQPVVGVDGTRDTVQERIHRAFDYLFKERLSSEQRLVYGATTMDWGDVQPEHPEGVFYGGGSIYIDHQTHPSLDIYDNAMMIMAMNNYAELCELDKNSTCAEKWTNLAKTFSIRARRVLWDTSRQKWRPHVYLSSTDNATRGCHSGSPFPPDFDEDSIYYHGGTTAAILAGLHTKEETKAAYEKMAQNAKLAGLLGPITVGLTNYPPYPQGMFGNLQNRPWGYQNGGDWPWWGGRTVQALVQMGLLDEASDALAPMVARTLKHNDFYEWYDRRNRPQGSARFHGAAGALAKAVHMLHEAQSTAEQGEQTFKTD